MTGSLTLQGGLGIAKNVHINQTLDVNGMPFPFATFVAPYSTNTTATFSLGTPTVASSVGNVSITGNKLQLTDAGSTISYITYTAAGNAPLYTTGAVKFLYTPAHSGIPTSIMGIFTVYANVTYYNQVLIAHLDTGELSVFMNDATGVIFMGFSSGWVPTSGQEYEIELDFNATDAYLFVDGSQVLTSTSLPGNFVRSTTIDTLQIGSDAQHNVSVFSNFSLRNLIIYNTLQHSANYTTGYSIATYTGSTSPTTGTLTVGGGLGVYENVHVGGQLHVENTTDSTTVTTGSIVTLGGLGVGQTLRVGSGTAAFVIFPPTCQTSTHGHGDSTMDTRKHHRCKESICRRCVRW
jgi:hypothetical protein